MPLSHSPSVQSQMAFPSGRSPSTASPHGCGGRPPRRCQVHWRSWPSSYLGGGARKLPTSCICWHVIAPTVPAVQAEIQPGERVRAFHNDTYVTCQPNGVVAFYVSRAHHLLTHAHIRLNAGRNPVRGVAQCSASAASSAPRSGCEDRMSRKVLPAALFSVRDGRDEHTERLYLTRLVSPYKDM